LTNTKHLNNYCPNIWSYFLCCDYYFFG